MRVYSDRWRIWFAYCVVALMVGCANMKSHDELVGQVHSAQRAGGFESALKALEASAESEEAKQALLFNLERSELLRLSKRYEESNKALLLADEKVKQWEETAKTDPSKLLGLLGAATISERLKTYEGQDYEKVWLTTRLALNRMSAQDWETARVDIKRTHEREAVIAEFRAKEIAAAEAEASEKGVTKTGKTIDGYPVETLDDPEVLSLKNGYQNALSHYLAGFLYEALNEPGLAAPGYRHAIELKPKTPFLEEGLASLDKRTSFTHKARQRKTDVLFLIEAGHAPARKSKAFTLPIPTGRSIRSVSVSYPIIEPSNEPLLTQVTVGSESFKLEKVVDLDVMARRVLRDEMPGMVLRNVTRAIVKGVMQDQLEKNAGLLGAVIGVVASAATENADDRMWRMLPGRVYLARGYLAPGTHKVQIDDRYVGIDVDVSGQYAIVPIRFYDQQVVTGHIGRFGELRELPAGVTPVAMPEAVVVPAPPPKATKPKPVPRPKPAPKKAIIPVT